MGQVVDRAGAKRPRNKLLTMAVLCVCTMLVLMPTICGHRLGRRSDDATQFALIVVGGLLMACTPGAASAVVIDVVHPGMRATGSSVLGLTQNLLGLAVGPSSLVCCPTPTT